MKFKNITITLLLIFSLLLVSACAEEVNVQLGSKNETNNESSDNENTSDKEATESGSDESIVDITTEELPKVQIEMEDGGIMVFELYPQYAPETVENFLSLVDSGFYDGLKFHRIIKGFMAQSGDPLGNGTGGSDTNIKGEFAQNGFDQNTLAHTKGVLSMARSRDMDSASSQFFLMDGDAPHLDGAYAGFGLLIEGEDVLDKITATEVQSSPQGEMSQPVTDVIIKAATIVE